MNTAMRNKFAQQYANNFVETAVYEATPHKLIEMLYDGLIKNLNLSKVFIQQKNYGKKAEHANKALSILMTLREGVDLDKGGEVADNLYSLYDYCYRRVSEASFKNDTAIIDEVLGHISGIKEAWNAMPENIKRASREQVQSLSSQ